MIRKLMRQGGDQAIRIIRQPDQQLVSLLVDVEDDQALALFGASGRVRYAYIRIII